jgi:hypothetical protein
MRNLITLCILLPSSLLLAQYPKSEAEAAKTFIKIFQKADTAALLGLLPPPSIYRMTAPDETQGKSDSEIVAMAEPLRNDMATGFRTLLREADSMKVDRSKIKLTDHAVTAVLNYPGFYGMRVFFSYGKKEGEFSLGTAFIDDVWYIYGIDQWEGVFYGMTTKGTSKK